LQYLVQKKGFTIFSIEAPMPEAYRLNDYVLDGKGDPKKLIANMQFWTWDTDELLAMVKWMYIYNQTAEKKIKFTGFDMQSPPANYKTNITDRLDKAGREDESQIVNQIITDIDPVNQKALEFYHAIVKFDAEEVNAFTNYSQLLAALKEKHLPDDEFKKEAAKLKLDYQNEIKKIEDQFDRVTAAIKDEINALVQPLNARIDALVNDINNNKNIFISKIGSDEYEWMLENIQIVKEYLQFQAGVDDFDIRDHLMVKNILWIAQQNPSAKLVLWAHNGHIGHSTQYPTMGTYLQNELADNYRAIGFLTYEGKYTAASVSGGTLKFGTFNLQIPPDEAIESIVDKLAMPIVLLNFSNKDLLPGFLHSPILSRCLWGIGAEEVPEQLQFNPPPGQSFSDYIGFTYDGVIYIKATTASQLWSSARYNYLSGHFGIM
jgi:erythromycin esterase